MGHRNKLLSSPLFGNIYGSLAQRIDATDQNVWIMNYGAAGTESLLWNKLSCDIISG